MSRLLALLIGNSDYVHFGKLKNGANDAQDLAQVLHDRGFETSLCVDAKIAEIDDAFQAFTPMIADGDVALFFFAGHGVQIDGENYLMGVDAPTINASAAKYQSLPLNRVIEDMRRGNNATNLIVLDACRTNPWAGSPRGGTAGLAPVYAPKGALIAFSTSPGETASDGKGDNGAYTAALLQHIGTADLPIETMFKRVRNTLDLATQGAQTSWEHTSLSGEFFFNLGVARRITEYGATALKDAIFVPDDSVWPHRLVKGLKGNSWGPQNEAMRGFSPTEADASTDDDLFLLGRNILQAADGTANLANEFISNFMTRTAGMSADKRKALLDGILFEIFFDANGGFRNNPKTRCFNKAFNLQAFPELSSSFQFISNALAPFASRFHAVPGKGHAVAIDISLLDEPNQAVENVMLAGRDVLRLDDPDYGGTDRMYRGRARPAFEDKLSQELMVPLRDLTITYNPSSAASPTAIRYPYGYSVRRPVAQSA